MNRLRSFLDTIFVIGLVSFMVLGSILVFGQLVGAFTLNGALTIKSSDILAKPAFVIASITGLIGFLGAYIHGWKMGE